MFKNWTWQKWLGKTVVLAIAVGEAIWMLIEKTPGWWLPATTFAAWLVQQIVGLFPPKTEPSA
jgi:membrane protein YdbS with pleckstrin-like domain